MVAVAADVRMGRRANFDEARRDWPEGGLLVSGAAAGICDSLGTDGGADRGPGEELEE